MNRKKVVRVLDVMRTEFDLVDGLSTVAEALMHSNHPEARCFIVNKRHEDDEYGILLLSDIAKNILSKKCQLKKRRL